MPSLIDNLRGPELDAAVALEVGWTQQGDDWYMPGQSSPTGHPWKVPFSYSENQSAAFSLLLEFSNVRIQFYIETIYIEYEHRRWDLLARGDKREASRLLCIAFLKLRRIQQENLEAMRNA
jgi:hypothetical protein